VVFFFSEGAGLGDLDLGATSFSGDPGATIEVGYPTLSVTVGGTDISTLTSLLGATASFGWDKPVAEARIHLTSKPDGITYGDQVQIEAGRKNPAVVRFVGIVRDWDYANWPRSVTLIARSELSKLEDVIPRSPDLDPDEGQPGIDLETLTGSSAGATLRQIVEAVCTYAGVPLPTFVYDPDHVFGAPDNFPEHFTWRAKESAMAYVHRVFEATAGARLFTSGDGQHYVAQIVGRPRGEPDLSLTEGVDILPSSTGERSIAQTRNAVRVYGADDGSGDGPLVVEVVESNDFQSADEAYFHEVSSELIETEAYATDIASYWLQETNRELVHARISTWRDEVQGPAQTHFVVSPRIGINGEPMWVLSHEFESSANAWTVTNELVGGGTFDDGSPVPV
jgi:hypothetical protein